MLKNKNDANTTMCVFQIIMLSLFPSLPLFIFLFFSFSLQPYFLLCSLLFHPSLSLSNFSFFPFFSFQPSLHLFFLYLSVTCTRINASKCNRTRCDKPPPLLFLRCLTRSWRRWRVLKVSQISVRRLSCTEERLRMKEKILQWWESSR